MNVMNNAALKLAEFRVVSVCQFSGTFFVHTSSADLIISSHSESLLLMDSEWIWASYSLILAIWRNFEPPFSRVAKWLQGYCGYCNTLYNIEIIILNDLPYPYCSLRNN